MSEVKIAALPRGIANSNPGNLRTGPKWKGQVGEDNGFAIFENAVTGIRAAALNLWTARYVHHRRTVREIIEVYAPPSENRTEAYVAYIADAVVPWARDLKKFVVEVANPIICQRFLQAQFVFENGHPPITWRSWPEWYCQKTMDQALAAAGHWPGLVVMS